MINGNCKGSPEFRIYKCNENYFQNKPEHLYNVCHNIGMVTRPHSFVLLAGKVRRLAAPFSQDEVIVKEASKGVFDISITPRDCYSGIKKLELLNVDAVCKKTHIHTHI